MSVLTLEGRTAVITGGAGGIGKKIALKLAEGGMNVAIFDYAPENAADICEKIRGMGVQSKAFFCDVSKTETLSGVLEDAENEFGSVDVIVNCAGVLDASTLGTLTEEKWRRVIDINLMGTYFMMQSAVPFLKKSKAGRIINISSNAGRMGGFETGFAYTASKGGIISMTYAAARKLAPLGITVNCVAPGTIETDMAKGFDPEAKARLLQRFPVGRLGRPEDVAAAICYFASEESEFTTGAVLDVNGGLFMG